MIKKIENDKKVGNAHIKILYPGSVIENSTDSGLGSIGRIDHANIGGNVTIKMHPHINDDILSYFRSGHAVHTDSEGFQVFGFRSDKYLKSFQRFGHCFFVIKEFSRFHQH